MERITVDNHTATQLKNLRDMCKSEQEEKWFDNFITSVVTLNKGEKLHMENLGNDTQVYCTNCVHFPYNLECMDNTVTNCILGDYCPCKECGDRSACCEPEDSRPFKDR